SDDSEEVGDNVQLSHPGPGIQRLQDERAEVETGEVTHRLAIVNLDWDHVRAADLMALFSSFTPPGTRVEKISIYPSEFGKKRMRREELEGPPRDIFKKASMDEEVKPHDPDASGDGSGVDGDTNDADSDDETWKGLLKEGNDEDFDSEALRSYQLDRLRY